MNNMKQQGDEKGVGQKMPFDLYIFTRIYCVYLQC